MMLDQNVMGSLIKSTTFAGVAQDLIDAEHNADGEEDALAAAREERVGADIDTAV